MSRADGRRRIALIGLGMAVTPHAKSLDDLRDRVDVVYAYSRSEKRRRQFAEAFDFPLADDLDAIIADPTLDAAMILTPPDAHFDIARRCAESGKHVLLEKPIERTTVKATELVQIADAAGVKLGIVLQHRFRAAAEKLRQLVDSGELGELALANAMVPWWRPQAYYDQPGRGSLARDGGGVLISQAIHTLDLLLSLTGPVAEVAAVAGTSKLHSMETEDFVGAGLRFENGALGGLIASTAQYPGSPERIELGGSKATAVLSPAGLELSYADGRPSARLVSEGTGSGAGADPMDFPHDAHRALLADFLAALENDREPRASGREALAVHHLIDALLLSSRERRVVEPASFV